MSAAAIIAAAGRGNRMKSRQSKQYLLLAGRPLLFYSIAACTAAECFTELIVVITPGEEELLRREVLLPFFPSQRITVTAGGPERQDSVLNGLACVGPSCRVVCVHDGARPLATPELLARTVRLADEKGSAIAAVPVKDTIKRVDGCHRVLETPPRQSLWSVQTPQAFRADWLKDAHRRAKTGNFTTTDDAGLLEKYGYPVHVTEGSYDNIKVTTPEDLVLAEILLGRLNDENRHRL